MKISILGSGNIGATLGKKWAEKGHTVTFGVRDVNASKHQSLLNTIEGEATVATVEEAIASGEIIVLAIPGTAVDETAKKFGNMLDWKIIIDATNRVRAETINSIIAISAIVPNAKLFRAFNSLGWENFEVPQLGGMQVDLFYCGETGEAQETVDQLIADIGLRPIYIGDLDQIDVIDSLTKLWFALAFKQGYGRRVAFKLLTDSS